MSFWCGTCVQSASLSHAFTCSFVQIEDALLSDETALSHRVGASLQRTDEFGRILTPKESFRDVSYAFHGYQRAASKKEKNLKQLKRDRAQSGLVDDAKNTPYLESHNPSQLVDDFKARKWRPKLKKKPKKKTDGLTPGAFGKKKADFIDKYVAQSVAAAAEAAEHAASAVQPMAVALPKGGGGGASAAAGEAGGADVKKGGDADRKLMPPPPPPPS
jgi:SART-1 family